MRDQLITLGQRLSFIDNSRLGTRPCRHLQRSKGVAQFPHEPCRPKRVDGKRRLPSVWNQQARKGMHLHWDGNNTSVDERNLSAAFGTGAYPPTLDSARVLRMAEYLETDLPPPYPYPSIRPSPGRGKPIYEQFCMSLPSARASPLPHPFQYGESESSNYQASALSASARLPHSTTSVQIHRASIRATWLLAVNRAHNAGTEGLGLQPPYPQRFISAEKLHGYANVPTRWRSLRYLHNGSCRVQRSVEVGGSDRPPKFFTAMTCSTCECSASSPTCPSERRGLLRLRPRNEAGEGHEGQDAEQSWTLTGGAALLGCLETFQLVKIFMKKAWKAIATDDGHPAHRSNRHCRLRISSAT